jgi:hypothetical protein
MGLAAMMTLAVLLAMTALAAWAQQDMQAELSLERTVQSAGLLPAAGEYVRYDLVITNSGGSEIAGQKLWVDFAPAQGEGTSAVFTVPAVPPGKSVQLHLGPFKMHEAGEHFLALGMNAQGDPNAPDEVSLDTGRPADSVTAYSPALAATLPVGIGVAAAGAGLVGWSFARRKKA